MFQSEDTLQDKINGLPFPEGVKVRVVITGLAVCQLNPTASRIHFVRHVSNHKLKMSVTGRERISGATTYPTKDFDVEKNSRIFIDVENPDYPPGVRTNGPYPLEKMLNLQALHRSPMDINMPSRISVADITGCAFYTIEYFPSGKFNLIEKGMVGDGATRDIGYVMGGNIKCLTTASKLKLSGAADPDLPAVLPGEIGGKEIVYDIILNNHCTKISECEKQVAPMGGTDFGFYYQVLDERLRPAREFLLKQKPSKSEKEDKDGTERDKSRDIISDIAACNPVIIDPSEPYQP